MCNRHSSYPAAIARGNASWLATALALAVALALPAQARDQSSLGDLKITADRVPDWHHLDHLPLDTASWSVTNVPCGNASYIRSAIRSAQLNTVVQLAASCTYVFATSSPFLLDKSRVVLRGAGPGSTILEFQHNDSTAIVLGLIGWPRNQVFGEARSWTDGYALGDRVLSVASTSGLRIGAWVRLRANNEPDWHSNARNGYSAKLVCVGSSGTDSCASLSSSQVKLDWPLNSVFTQGGQVLERVTGHFVEFAGIENLRIQHSTPDRIESYRPRIEIEDCHECWVTSTSVGDAGNSHISISDSSRVLMRGNDFGSNQCTNNGKTCLWNKGAVYWNQHSYDTVFENNSVVDTPSGPLLQNGGGNVVAYNYLTANPSVQCERHIFLHGQAVRSSLIEGNDVSCMMQWDSFRGGQGYYNTFYRNRLRDTPETGASYQGYYRGRIGGELQGSFIHRYIQVIGNHANELRGGPFARGVGLDHSRSPTEYHYRTWVSYNVARSNIELDPRATESTDIENRVGTLRPSVWNGIDFPRSLYRSAEGGRPSWWCSESGPFPNIGAMSDSTGSYSKLPAQIRLEGGACTTGASLPAKMLEEPPLKRDH